MGKNLLVVALELTAAAGLMLYSTANPDINILATIWLTIWKASQTVAHAAGKLGMRAELRYFEVVKA